MESNALPCRPPSGEVAGCLSVPTCAVALHKVHWPRGENDRYSMCLLYQVSKSWSRNSMMRPVDGTMNSTQREDMGARSTRPSLERSMISLISLISLKWV